MSSLDVQVTVSDLDGSKTRLVDITVRNVGAEAVRIEGLAPSFPSVLVGADRPVGSVLSDLEPKRATLTAELSRLLADEWAVQDKAIFEARRREVAAAIDDAFRLSSGSSGARAAAMRAVWFLVSPARVVAMFLRRRTWEPGVPLRVDTSAEAVDELNRLRELPGRSAAQVSIEAKIAQLSRLETRIRDTLVVLPAIEPGGEHEEKLALVCRSRWFRPTQVPISVDVSGRLPSGGAVGGRATGVVSVPPSRLALAVLAAFAGLCGYVVRSPLSIPADEAISVRGVAVSMIVGFFGFVCLQLFDFGPIRRQSVSWLSALVVGFAGGLAQENVLNAFRALLGLN
mgnify:CR=1 FL=1